MTTSAPANVSSPANISPVGPAPAITTACSVTSHRQHDWVACGKPPPSRYAAHGGQRGDRRGQIPLVYREIDTTSALNVSGPAGSGAVLLTLVALVRSATCQESAMTL